MVDWIKHAFVVKFNHISPTVYSRFTSTLCHSMSPQLQQHAQRHVTREPSRRHQKPPRAVLAPPPRAVSPRPHPPPHGPTPPRPRPTSPQNDLQKRPADAWLYLQAARVAFTYYGRPGRRACTARAAPCTVHRADFSRPSTPQAQQQSPQSTPRRSATEFFHEVSK